jgi:hypothetical protein
MGEFFHSNENRVDAKWSGKGSGRFLSFVSGAGESNFDGKPPEEHYLVSEA